MAVLHIMVNAFWNRNSGMSGGDKRVIEILKQWENNTEQVFSVRLYAPKEFLDIVKQENIQNVELLDTTPKGSEKKGLLLNYILRTRIALKKMPRGEENQIFYSSSDYFPDVIPCLVGKRKNSSSKWLALVHHIIEHYKNRPGSKLKNIVAYVMQQISLKRICRKSDQILLVSPLVRKYMLDHHVEDAKIKLINNGVDVDYIDNLNPYEEFPKQYDGLMLARLAESKGVHDLPIIWSKVVKQCPKARLGVIGGGTQEIVQSLKEECIQLGIQDQIDFLGFVDTESAYRLLKSGKVFIFTSREEGWGISLAEAMACGLPVVAFELPVYKYIFKNYIHRIENRDSDMFAKKVAELLENNEQRQSEGLEAYQFVKNNYDWKEIARLESVIVKSAIS